MAKKSFKACHRYARITARKARYVMDLVRNKPVGRALELLRFTQRRAAPLIAQVVQSAVANAEQEGGARAENLVITSATVDEGPTWKRWRPRARGMAYPILKRTSHLNIEVSEAVKMSRAASSPEAGSAETKG
jgi:large subunit ribosomal protein L22